MECTQPFLVMVLTDHPAVCHYLILSHYWLPRRGKVYTAISGYGHYWSPRSLSLLDHYWLPFPPRCCSCSMETQSFITGYNVITGYPPHPPVVKCTLALLVILPVGAALVVW